MQCLLGTLCHTGESNDSIPFKSEKTGQIRSENGHKRKGEKLAATWTQLLRHKQENGLCL